MTSTAGAPTQASTTTQVYRIFIRATPQAIWDAITKPEWTERFGYGLRDEYDLRPGGAYRGRANDGMKALTGSVSSSAPSSYSIIAATEVIGLVIE